MPCRYIQFVDFCWKMHENECACVRGVAFHFTMDRKYADQHYVVLEIVIQLMHPGIPYAYISSQTKPRSRFTTLSPITGAMAMQSTCSHILPTSRV